MGIETSSSALVKAMFPVFLNWIIQGGDTAEQRVVRVSIVCEIPCDSVVVTRPTSVYSAHEGVCVCQFASGTCWGETFHCHRTSEAWSVGADPSRCSVTPRGWVLHPPTHTHTYNNNYQDSWSEGKSCWPPATAAQYQVYVQEQTLAAFTGWTLSSWRNLVRSDPPFYLYSTGVKSRLRRQRIDCFGSRTHHRGEVFWFHKTETLLEDYGHTAVRVLNTGETNCVIVFKTGEKKELNSEAPTANQVFIVHILQLNNMINQILNQNWGLV